MFIFFCILACDFNDLLDVDGFLYLDDALLDVLLVVDWLTLLFDDVHWDLFLHDGFDWDMSSVIHGRSTGGNRLCNVSYGRLASSDDRACSLGRRKLRSWCVQRAVLGRQEEVRVNLRD